MEIHKNRKVVSAPTRKHWRNWLEKNHAREESVWLIIHNKNSKSKSVSYVEAVEEALCFGWIDSTPNKRDHESHYQSFSPRKPNSVWSESNRQRVKKLTADGLMRPAGQAMIDLAKKNGKWMALKHVEEIVIPDDLKKAFSKSKKASKNFESFPPSSQKIILYWIFSAKRPETRSKRIAETVTLAAKNIRANEYKRKGQ